MDDRFTITPGTPLTVTIFAPDGTHISQTEITDARSAEQAVREAITDTVLIIPEQDCVYVVKNMNNLQEQEYRFDAHHKLTRVI